MSGNLELFISLSQMPSSINFRVGCVVSLTANNKADLFLSVAEALCELGHEVVVLAQGEEAALKQAFVLADQYPHLFRVLEDLPQNRESLLSTVDVLVFPVEPSKDQKQECIESGVIPVLPKTPGFENFEPDLEKGNSFVFQKNQIWHVLNAVIRASENHKFSYDWQQLKKAVQTLGSEVAV